MMTETSEGDFNSSASESEESDYEQFIQEKERPSLVFFILGAALIAPFTTFVCASEDVLAGTKRPTGLVVIALTAPSCVLKVASLCFKNISQVVYIFIASGFVVAGQFCAVFAPNLAGRFTGICLVSVGTGIGEVSLFMQAAVEFQEMTLSSFIAGTGVGGVLGAVLYVGLTVWAPVDPRTAILVSAIWPAIFLLTFAVFRESLLSEKRARMFSRRVDLTQLFEVDCRLTSQWKERLASAWNVSHHLLVLFLVYFGEYIVLCSILTTLSFNHSGDGSEFVPRGHFEHYVLSTMVGEFLGRTFMSMLRAVAPGFYFTAAPIVAFFPLAETIFLVVATWFRLVPAVWIVWLLCFVQGTSTGMIFSNSYHIIAKRCLSYHVIFNLTFASILETAGILTAGFLGIHVESLLEGHCLQHFSGCLTRSTDSQFWEFGNRFYYRRQNGTI